MNKEKYLELKINWYRQLFTLFSAITIACIAWLVSNYDKTILQLIILDCTAIVAAAIGIMIINIKIRKYFKIFKDN